MSRFKRKQSVRPYRKNIVFVTEGESYEKAYLQIVWNRLGLREYATPRFCHDKSSIPSLIKSALAAEASPMFKASQGDEIWIILDYDKESHFESQFRELEAWESEKAYRHVVISSPRFEYWLLWHFQKQPNKEKSKSDDYVKQILPNFKSLSLYTIAITKENVLNAAEKACSGLVPSCTQPSITGSGMGRLVNRLSSLIP